MPTQIGDLTLQLRLDKSKYDRDIRQLQQQTRSGSHAVGLSPVTFDVKVRVDDIRLFDLNRHFDAKARHHKALQQQFDNNPLKPRVDTSELNKLERLYRGVSGGAINVVHTYTNPRRLPVDSSYRRQELLARDTALILKQGIKEGFKEAGKGNLFGAITSPFKQIVSGSLFRLGQNVTDRGVKKFAASERGNGIFQELDLATEKAAEALSSRLDNIASVFGGYDGRGDAARDLIRDLGAVVETVIDPDQFETLLRETSNGVARSIVRIESGTSDLATEIVSGLSLIQSQFKTQINNLAYRTIQTGAFPFKLNAQLQAARSANKISDVLERETQNGKIQRFRSITDDPGLQGKDVYTLIAPGFQKEQGKAGMETVKMLEPFFDLNKTALIPVRNTYTDRKANDTKSDLNDFIVSMFGSNPLGQEGLSMVMNIEKLLGTSIQGVNPDSVRLAALAFALDEKFPNAQVQLAGFSGGGYIVEEAISILEMLGKNIKGLGFGSPLMGLTNRASGNFQAIVGNSDPLTFSYSESVLGKLPEETKQVLIEKLGIPDRLIGQGIVNPPGNTNILKDYVGGHDMQAYLQSKEGQEFMRKHLSGTKSAFARDELPLEIRDEPALQEIISMLSEAKILDSGLGARSLANIGQIQRKLIKPSEVFEQAISNPSDLNLKKLGQNLSSASEQLAKFERVIKLLENTFRAKNFDNLPPHLDKKYVDSGLKLLLEEIPYVKDAKANISRINESKTEASRVFLEKSGYDAKTLEQIDPEYFFDLASYVGKRRHDDANVLRGIELYENPGIEPQTKGSFEFYNPDDADKRVNFDFRDYIQLALEGLVKNLPQTLKSEGNDFVRRMKALQEAWSQYLKHGTKVPKKVLDEAKEALNKELKLDISQLAGQQKKVKTKKSSVTLDSLKEEYRVIQEQKGNKPQPLEIKESSKGSKPNKFTTEVVSKMDKIIDLLGRNDGGNDGGASKSNPTPDTPPALDLVEVVAEAKEKAEGRRTGDTRASLDGKPRALQRAEGVDGQTLVNNTLQTTKNTVKSILSGVIENFDGLYREAQKWEKVLLDLAPGQLGHVAKRATQYTAVPIAAGMAAGGIPGLEQAIGAIHGLADLGLHDLAQGLADGIMDSISSSMPQAFGSIMDSLSNVPGVGQYFTGMRQIPGQMVHSASDYIIGHSGRTLADIGIGSAVIKGGQDAYNALANGLDPERRAKLEAVKEQALLNRVDDYLSVSYKPKDSAEITSELEGMKLEQAFKHLQESTEKTARKLDELFTTAGLRKLAPMVGIASTADAGGKPVKSAKKAEIANLIAHQASDAEIDAAIASASPDMFRSKYKGMGVVKPQMNKESFDSLSRYWQEEIEKINSTPLQIIDPEEAIAALQGFGTAYRRLLKENELTGEQRSSLGSRFGTSQELKAALEAFSKFSKIDDLSSKFQTGASKAGQNWGNTSADILKQFRILSSEAKAKGYDIQRFISEGSPGPTERIRKHWLKTTKYLLGQISQIREQAAISGSKIQQAFADDPQLGIGLDRVQSKLESLQSLLQDVNATSVIAVGGDELEGKVTGFLGNKHEAIEKIEAGRKPRVDTLSNNSALLSFEDKINAAQKQRLQHIREIRRVSDAHYANEKRKQQELQRIEQERFAQLQRLKHVRDIRNLPRPQSQEELSPVDKIRNFFTGKNKAKGLQSVLFGEAEFNPDDPLGFLKDIYKGYESAVDNAPNSYNIFKGINEFLDEATAKSPILGKILNFGKNVGISAIGIYSFDMLGDRLAQLSVQLFAAGNNLERFKIQMLSIGKDGSLTQLDIFDRAQDLGTNYLVAREGYQRFVQSVQGTGDDTIVDPIFEGFQDAFVGKRVNAEAQARGYRAIEQILSKGGLDGSVQSEELKGQLAEALPGSYATAAAVRGQSPRELAQDMKAAKVEAADLLLRMAAFYEVDSEILLRVNADSFDAELTRVQNNLALLQESAGENLLPFGKWGLKATNVGLGLLANNFGVVATVGGGVFLSTIFAIAKAMGMVAKDAKLATIAMKVFGIEALQQSYQKRGIVGATGNILGNSIRALAAPVVLGASIDLGTKILTEGRGSRSSREATKIIQSLSEPDKPKIDEKDITQNPWNPWWTISQRGRQRTGEEIYSGMISGQDELEKIRQNIYSSNFDDNLNRYREINSELQLLKSQKARYERTGNLQPLEQVDNRIGELTSEQKQVLKVLTGEKAKIEAMKKGVSTYNADLEQIRPYFSENYYQGQKEALNQLEDDAQGVADTIDSLIQTTGTQALYVIRRINTELANTKFQLDLELNEQSISNIDRKVAGLIGTRQLDIANTQARLDKEQSSLAATSLQKQKAKSDILQESGLAALKDQFGVSNNSDLFSVLNRTSPEDIQDKIASAKTPDLKGALEIAEKYAQLNQQENQERYQAKNTELELANKQKEYAISLREFGNSIRDVSRSLEDFQISKDRFEVDFPLQVQDANRNLARSTRNLQEQYNDLFLSLDKQIAQSSLEIAQIEKEIANSLARGELLRTFSGNQSIGREIAELFNSYSANIQTDEEKQLQQNLTRLEIEEQTVQISRQIRALSEQKVDLERDRVNQQLQLTRQQEDFNRQQQRTWEDALDKWWNIEMQSKELGINLDITAEQVAQQGTNLIQAIAELAQRIKGKGSNLTNGNSSFPLPGLTLSSANVTSDFGWRTIFGKSDFHEGIDIAAKAGTPVSAVNSGTVRHVLPLVDQMQVGIETAKGVMEWFVHLGKNLKVQKGDFVFAGQEIGAVASTSDLARKNKISTGDHLDYRVEVNGEWTNPKPWLQKKAEGRRQMAEGLPKAEGSPKGLASASGQRAEVAPDFSFAPIQSSYSESELIRKAKEYENIRTRKLELTPEQQEAKRLEELESFIDGVTQKYKQLNEVIRQSRRSTADSFSEIEKMAAQRKGYLTKNEEIYFAGKSVETEYIKKIQSLQDEKRQLQEQLFGEKALIFGANEYGELNQDKQGKLYQALEKFQQQGNEKAIAFTKGKINQTQEAIAEIEKELKNKEGVQVEIEASLNLAKTKAQLEKAFEIDISQARDNLSLQQDIFNARQDSGSMFTFGKDGIRARERELGAIEIELDYQQRLKELDRLKGKNEEVTDAYIEQKKALDELRAIKLDNLIEQTSTWGRTIRESITEGVGAGVDYFTDNLIGNDVWDTLLGTLQGFATDFLGIWRDLGRQIMKEHITKWILGQIGESAGSGSNAPAPGGGILGGLFKTGVGAAVGALRYGSDDEIPHYSHGNDTLSMAAGLQNAIARENHPYAYPAVIHKGEKVLSDLISTTGYSQSDARLWDDIKRGRVMVAPMGINTQAIDNFNYGSDKIGSVASQNMATYYQNSNSSSNSYAQTTNFNFKGVDETGFRRTRKQIAAAEEQERRKFFGK